MKRLFALAQARLGRRRHGRKSGKVDARIGKRMERVILRAVADYGSVHGGSEAYAVIAGNLFREQHGGRQTHTMGSLVAGLIRDGLLSPLYSHLPGTSRGLTIKGWERLYQLEHPRREWLGRNWFPFVVAVTAIASSVVAAVALFV